MGSLVRTGKWIYQLKRFPRSSQSLSWVSTSPGTGCWRRTGSPSLLSTVTHGLSQLLSFSEPGLALTKLIGMSMFLLGSRLMQLSVIDVLSTICCRKRLFNMVNDLPSVFEVVVEFAAKKQSKEKSSVSNNSSNRSKSNSKVKCFFFLMAWTLVLSI